MLFLTLWVGLSLAGGPTEHGDSLRSNLCSQALEASSVIDDLYADLKRVHKLGQAEIRYLRGRFNVPYLHDEGVKMFYRNLLYRAVGWIQMGHLVDAFSAVERLRTTPDFETYPSEWRNFRALVLSEEGDPALRTHLDGDFFMSIAAQPRYFPQNVRQLQALALVFEAYMTHSLVSAPPKGFAKAARAVLVSAGFTAEVAAQYWQSIQHDGLQLEFAFQVKETDGQKVNTCCGQGCADFCPKNVLALACNHHSKNQGGKKFPVIEGEPPATLLLFRHFPEPEITDKVKPEWLPWIQRLWAKEGGPEVQPEWITEDIAARERDHQAWLDGLRTRSVAWAQKVDARSSVWRMESPALEAEASRIDRASAAAEGTGVSYASSVQQVLTSLVVTLHSILEGARDATPERVPTVRIVVNTGEISIGPEVGGSSRSIGSNALRNLIHYGLESGLSQRAAEGVASAMLRDLAAGNLELDGLSVHSTESGGAIVSWSAL